MIQPWWAYHAFFPPLSLEGIEFFFTSNARQQIVFLGRVLFFLDEIDKTGQAEGGDHLRGGERARPGKCSAPGAEMGVGLEKGLGVPESKIFFVGNTKSLLFINDQQTKIFE